MLVDGSGIFNFCLGPGGKRVRQKGKVKEGGGGPYSRRRGGGADRGERVSAGREGGQVCFVFFLRSSHQGMELKLTADSRIAVESRCMWSGWSQAVEFWDCDLEIRVRVLVLGQGLESNPTATPDSRAGVYSRPVLRFPHGWSDRVQKLLLNASRFAADLYMDLLHSTKRYATESMAKLNTKHRRY